MRVATFQYPKSMIYIPPGIDPVEDCVQLTATLKELGIQDTAVQIAGPFVVILIPSEELPKAWEAIAPYLKEPA